VKVVWRPLSEVPNPQAQRVTFVPLKTGGAETSPAEAYSTAKFAVPNAADNRSTEAEIEAQRERFDFFKSRPAVNRGAGRPGQQFQFMDVRDIVKKIEEVPVLGEFVARNMSLVLDDLPVLAEMDEVARKSRPEERLQEHLVEELYNLSEAPQQIQPFGFEAQKPRESAHLTDIVVTPVGEFSLADPATPPTIRDWAERTGQPRFDRLPPGFLEKTAAAWGYSKYQSRLGHAAREYIETRSPESAARVRELIASRPTPPVTPDTNLLGKIWYGGIAAGGASMWEGFLSSQARGLAAATAVGVAAAGLEAAPGAGTLAHGAITGGAYAVGSISGLFDYMGGIEGGLAAAELMEQWDRLGQPWDYNLLCKVYAGTYLVNGALETLGTGAMIRAFPGGRRAISRITNRAVREAVRRGPIRTGVRNFAQGWAGEFSTETLQNFATNLATNWAARQSNRWNGTTLPTQSFVDVVAETVSETPDLATATALFPMLGGGATVVTEAARGLSQIDALSDPIRRSRLASELPAKFEELLQGYVEKGVLPKDIFLNPRELQALFQDDLTGLTQLLKDIEMSQEDFQEYLDLNMEIKVPGRKLGRLLNNEKSGELKQMASVWPMNRGEPVSRAETREQTEQAEAQEITPPLDPAQRVSLETLFQEVEVDEQGRTSSEWRDALVESWVGQGVPRREAQANAALIDANARVWSLATNRPVSDYYAKMGYKLRRMSFEEVLERTHRQVAPEMTWGDFREKVSADPEFRQRVFSHARLRPEDAPTIPADEVIAGFTRSDLGQKLIDLTGFSEQEVLNYVQGALQAYETGEVRDVVEGLLVSARKAAKDAGYTDEQIQQIEQRLYEIESKVNDLMEEVGGKDALFQEQTSTDKDIVKPLQDSLGFYSPLARAIEGMDFKTIPAKDLISRIKKTPGIKQEELDDLGLFDWLEGVEGKVSKDQVLAFIEEGGPKLEEVVNREEVAEEFEEDMVTVYGDADEGFYYMLKVGDRESNQGPFDTEEEAMDAARQWYEEHVEGDNYEAKYSMHQLPGGENYREVRIIIPGGDYASSHWDEFGVVVHFRINDRVDKDGKRSLFIEEIQSDWHQEGRKKGYGPQESREEFEARNAEARQIASGVVYNGNEYFDISGLSAAQQERARYLEWYAQAGILRGDEVAEWANLMAEARPATAERLAAVREARANWGGEEYDPGIPDAPFKKSWALLAFKRVLRMAAREGYDAVAWTPGEVQFNRWGSEEIAWKKVRGGFYLRDKHSGRRSPLFETREQAEAQLATMPPSMASDLEIEEAAGSWTVAATEQLGGRTGGINIEEEARRRGELLETSGQAITSKEELANIAKSVLSRENTPEQIDKIVDRVWERMQNEEEGSSLPRKEGMEGFYDKILPKEVGKYIKKLDKKAKVGTTEISTRGRGGGQEVWTVPVTDKMRDEILEQGQPLYQEKRFPTPRGAMVREDGQAVIYLFERADRSTLPHEVGHVFRQVLEELALDEATPQWCKDDWAKACSFVGARVGKEWTRKQEEKWARAFEQYLFEGKAPSPELRSVFQTFRRWLLAVYHKILGLGIKLDPEIEGVFQRMLATEAEIEDAKQTAEVVPVVGREAGEDYQTLLNQVNTLAADKIEQRRTSELARMEKQWAKEAKQVAKNDPRNMRLDKIVKAGGVSRAALLDAGIDEEAIGKLAKMRRGLVKKEGGQTPQALGFDSAPEMVKWGLKVKPRQSIAEAYIARSRDAWEANWSAADAVVTEELERLAEMESEILAKAVQRRNLQGTRLKTFVEEQVGKRKVKDILGDYRNLIAVLKREAQAARRAYRLGQKEEALVSNEKRRMALAKLRAQQSARQEVQKILKRVKRVAGQGNIAWDWHEQVLALVEQFGLGTKTMIPRRPEEMPTLRDFLTRKLNESRIEDDSEPTLDIPIADWILATPQRGLRKPKDYTLEQLRDLDEAVRFLAHQGVREGQIRHGERLMNLEFAAQACAEPMQKRKRQIRALTERQLKTFFGKVRAWGRRFIAELLKPEYLVDSADGYSLKKGVVPDEQRPNYTHITRRLVQAREDETVLWEVYQQRISALLENFDPGRLKYDIDVPLPNDVAHFWEGLWNKEKIIAVALNMGNEGNRNALMKGYGWEQEHLDKIVSYLDDADWDFVEQVWELVDEMFPRVDQAYFNLHGVKMKKVRAEPFVTPNGRTVRGGYYPLIFDRRFSDRAAEHIEQEDLMNRQEAVYQKPNARSGFTKARKGGTLPPVLNLNVFVRHLSDSIHYATHAEAVADVHKLIKTETYKEAFVGAFGREAYDQLTPWLRHIARPNQTKTDPTEQVMGWIHARASIYVLGLNASVALKQPAGVFHTAKEVGFREIFRASGQMVTSGREMIEMIQSLSPAMKHRARNLDKEIRRSLDRFFVENVRTVKLGKRHFGRQEFEEMMYWFIVAGDAVHIYPGWLAAYNRGMEQTGGDIEASARYADEVIRKKQPSGHPMDLAAFQRDRHGIKMLFNFCSSFTMQFLNSQMFHFREWRAGTMSTREWARHFVFEWVMPQMAISFAFALLTGDWPDLDDLLFDLGLHWISGIPGLRNMAGYAFNRSVTRSAPTDMIDRIVQDTHRAITFGTHVAKGELDEEEGKKVIWGALDSIGFLAGVPTKWAHRAAQGVEKWKEGSINPMNFLIYAPPDKNKKDSFSGR